MTDTRLGKKCAVPACPSLISASCYGKLCKRHYNHRLNNGDPLQLAVSKSELEPYARFARVRLEVEPYAAKTIPHVEAAALLLREWAGAIMASRASGRASSKHEAAAAETVLAVLDGCEHDYRALAANVAGMAVMRHDLGHRFASEAGYRHQLAYRFMRTNDALRIDCGRNSAGRRTTVVNRKTRATMQWIGRALESAFDRWCAWSVLQWDRLEQAKSLTRYQAIGLTTAPIPELQQPE